MSVRFQRRRDSSEGGSGRRPGRAGTTSGASLRRPALAGVAVISLSYLSVLYHITDVVGGSGLLLLEAATVAAAATLAARLFRTRQAMVLSVGLLVFGGAAYFFSVPESQRALFSVGSVARDTAALLTGLSALRLTQAGTWAMTVLPAPLFASWFLAVRGRTVRSVAVAGGALGFFVLTGDAGAVVTLAGTLGGIGAVGLHTLSVRGALSTQWDTLVVLLTAMIVASTLVSAVPGGGAEPLFTGGNKPNSEAALVANGDRLGIVGAISLSPEVRFTVEADRKAYWRTGSYNRYTGQGWVRSGETSGYRDDVDGPPGSSARLEQTVTAESTLNAMPAAWKPVSVDGPVASSVRVTAEEGFRSGDAIEPDESYTVVSELPTYDDATLREAGTDYPDAVQRRYTQLPESTPDRVSRRTQRVLANADASNPYEAALAIENYLETTKEYSLEVERPNGNVADSFLFEMDAGYCTYYATTMAVMLRSQGIPARMATGYTPGERVAEDRWVVRGLDAHTWVEVYFPGVGWVPFDPTPAGPRDTIESDRIEQARESDVDGVDAAGSGPGEWTSNETTTTTAINATEGELGAGIPNPQRSGLGADVNTPPPADLSTATVAAADGEASGGSPFSLPDRETVGYAAVFAVGLAAAARRFGLTAWGYRRLWLRYQPRTDPTADAERAYRRLEYLLGQRHRQRRPGETPRAYVEWAVARGADDRALSVVDAYERARYGGTVAEATADEAVATVDAVVGAETPVLGRLRGRFGTDRATR
ncbi:MAG: DUF3488 and DUF4129 domain-containing transglutaminase family protein [Halolamina sp.]